MSLPLLLAALLGSLVGVLVAIPLWRQRHYRSSAALAAVLALACAGLYSLLGTPAAWQPVPAADSDAQDLADNTERLRQALQADPAQAEGWVLLARAEALLGNGEASAQAWQQALHHAPGQPALLVEAAQARADAHPQRQIDDTALAWLEQARRLDPQAQRALWLIGIAQRQRGQPAAAAQTWQQLLALLDAGTAASVREQIDIARQQAGLPPLGEQPVARAEPEPAPLLVVDLALDEALAGRVRLDPQTPVFIQVRDSAGSPMPVAAHRLLLGQLPTVVGLDDRHSVMPGKPLSGHQRVQVNARIAVSGSATRSPGDVETPAVSVQLPANAPVVLRLQP